MTKTQERYLSEASRLGRLLNDDEAFDFYIDHVMRNDATCFINQWKIRNGKRGVREDYDLWQLVSKARQWHKLTIGSLVIAGEFGLTISDT